jgi:hypothetical protein
MGDFEAGTFIWGRIVLLTLLIPVTTQLAETRGRRLYCDHAFPTASVCVCVCVCVCVRVVIVMVMVMVMGRLQWLPLRLLEGRREECRKGPE